MKKYKSYNQLISGNLPPVIKGNPVQFLQSSAPKKKRRKVFYGRPSRSQAGFEQANLENSPWDKGWEGADITPRPPAPDTYNPNYKKKKHNQEQVFQYTDKPYDELDQIIYPIDNTGYGFDSIGAYAPADKGLTSVSASPRPRPGRRP